MAVLRLLPDGTIDTTFGTNGWAFVAFDQGGSLFDEANALCVDSTGRIVLAGDFSNLQSNDWAVARLQQNGQIDPNFGSGGRVVLSFDLGGYNDDRVKSVACLPDGRILVGGSVDTGGYAYQVANDEGYFAAAVMLKSNGTADPNFGTLGRYLEGDANTAYAAAIINPTRFAMTGDYVYFPGTTFKANGSDKDFGAARLILPLFKNGFEGN
jgi:uncharacterized delta-60 repeat protein